MRYCLLNVLLLIAGSLSAQTATPSVNSTAGGHFQNSSLSVDQTIGEPLTATQSTTGNILTQGFHQPFISTVGTEEWTAAEVKLYPNPAENYATVVLPHQTYTVFSVYDAAGKLVVKQEITSDKFDLSVADWAPGMYKLSLEGTFQTTLTFIKH